MSCHSKTTELHCTFNRIHNDAQWPPVVVVVFVHWCMPDQEIGLTSVVGGKKNDSFSYFLG